MNQSAWGVGLVVLGSLLDGCSDGEGGRATPDAPALESFCGKTSWVAGVTELCNGHLVYRDYVYDDYGADNGQGPNQLNDHIGLLAPSAGDARYPAGAENTADLVRLELWLEGDEVVVEFELNTLYQAQQTMALLALDTDDSAGTGGGAFPDLGVTAPGWDRLEVFDTGDPDSNTIRGRFAKPAGSVWNLWALVAQADGTVMNLAFRGMQEQAGADASPNQIDSAKGSFWEDQQAQALGTGDIGAFGARVEVAELERGVTRGNRIAPGLHQRVYTSAYTLAPGEGIAPAGVPGRHGDTGNPCEQYFHYLGKYQPYAIYLPDQAGPHGLQFALHGCNANHASLINQPGMQQQFGEALNRIILVPLGRGPVGFYSDISERDVLDVYDDVLANYAVDPEQIVMGGYSMGGYGTLRLAALYPQRFAAATNWVGFTGDIFNLPLPGNPLPPQTGGQGSSVGAVGNVIDFLGNLRHIPIVNLYAGADELVQAPTTAALAERFGATADVVYDFYLHPGAEHLTFAALDDWTKEAAFSAGRRRVQNPARITYRTDAALDYPEYGIRHDAAYWLSQIVGRGAGYIDLDVKSLGCGQPEPQFTDGQDGGVGPLPLAWVRTFRQRSGETPVGAENRLEATLANLDSVRLDLAGACLDSTGLAYRITTDGPVTIRFSDGRVLSLERADTHEGRL